MVSLTFGEQVKIILNRKGMTIKELAGKAVCVISGNWFHLLNLRSLSKIKFSIPRFL